MIVFDQDELIASINNNMPLGYFLPSNSQNCRTLQILYAQIF